MALMDQVDKTELLETDERASPSSRSELSLVRAVHGLDYTLHIGQLWCVEGHISPQRDDFARRSTILVTVFLTLLVVCFW